MFLRVDKLQIELPAPAKQDPTPPRLCRSSWAANTARCPPWELSLPKLQLPQQEQASAVLQPCRRHYRRGNRSRGAGQQRGRHAREWPGQAGWRRRDGGDISGAPYEAMKDVRLAGAFFSHAGGAVPVNSNAMSWNADMVTTTGNVIVDLLHNFHLECGARLHKLRVYETLSDPTGREVCGYLLVRGSVHAHAYALALKKLTGVELEKFLPTPNIPLGAIPECQKYLESGSHRRLYTFSPSDYQELAGIWGGDGEAALPDDPPGELEVVEGAPDGGKIHNLTGVPSAFTPDYAPEEMFEIASKLYKKSR